MMPPDPGDVWMAGSKKPVHNLDDFRKGDEVCVNGRLYEVQQIDFDGQRNMQITLSRKV